MRYAIDVDTSQEVEASRYPSRNRRYRCPCCGVQVFLRAGDERVAYFAHKPGMGRPECEEYHPGQYLGDTGIRASLAERWTLVEPDARLMLGLLLSRSTWSLVLHLPEATSADFGNLNPELLANTRLTVVNEHAEVGSVSLIDLWPGQGGGRLALQPSVQPYRVVNGAGWPTKVPASRWLGSTAGLNPRGTLFGMRRGEWVRLSEGAVVLRDESLCVVATPVSTPPPQVRAESLGNSGIWQAWRVRLPHVPVLQVDAWLSSLGYVAIAPAWRVAVVSAPIDRTPDVPAALLAARTPIVLVMVTPPSRKSGTLVVRGAEHGKKTVTSPPGSSMVYVAVWPELTGRFELALQNEAKPVIDLDVGERPSIDRLKQWLQRQPRLVVGCGDRQVSAWTEPLEVAVEFGADPEPVSVSLGHPMLDGPIGVAWEGTVRGYRAGLNCAAAEALLRQLLASGVALEIRVDAASWGQVTLRLQGNSRRVHRPLEQKPQRIAAWARSATLARQRLGNGHEVRPAGIQAIRTVPELLPVLRAASRAQEKGRLLEEEK